MDANDRDFSSVRTQRRDGVSATESVKTVAVARQRMYRAQRLPSRPVAHNSGAAGWAGGPLGGPLAETVASQNALLMNSSVGLGLGKAVSLPGLASVKKGRNTVPCESRPW